MPTSGEAFDLNAIFSMVGSAFCAIVSNIGFQVAAAGLFVALVIGIIGVVCNARGKRTGKPLLTVFRKLAIFCSVLAIPGAICLCTVGKLPQVNQLVLNPFGLVGFWGLVTAHLCMEEMNFEWFPTDK